MDNFTVIEDIFEDNRSVEPRGGAGIMAARNFMNNSHIPDDMRPRRMPQQMAIPPLPQGPPQQGPPPMGAPPTRMENPFGSDLIQCRDVFFHTENCPICSSYFKKDIKFYWIIIFILVLFILFLMRKRD